MTKMFLAAAYNPESDIRRVTEYLYSKGEISKKEVTKDLSPIEP